MKGGAGVTEQGIGIESENESENESGIVRWMAMGGGWVQGDDELRTV